MVEDGLIKLGESIKDPMEAVNTEEPQQPQPAQQSPSNHLSAVIEILPEWDAPASHLSSFSWRNINAWCQVKDRKSKGKAVLPVPGDGSTIVRAETASTMGPSQVYQPSPYDNVSLRYHHPFTSASHYPVAAGGTSIHPTKKKSTNCFGRRKKTKHILQDVSGYVRRGELVALMGSSGAGKTTLLNILTFRTSSKIEVDGDVCINGIKTGPKELNAISAYIQQGDLLPGALTVREYLIFCAYLKMDPTATKKERYRRVQDVIEELGLTKCQNTRIGIPGRIKGISGGEKRRVSVASEILWNPDLIFCDEPLSGLDSFTAEDLMKQLRFLSSKLHKTVICTIHQPSSKIYLMFDRSIFLSEGKLAYSGTLDNAFDFFSGLGYSCPMYANPSDFFIELLTITPEKMKDNSRARVEEICDAFSLSPLQREIMDFVNAPVVHDAEYEKELLRALALPKYRTSWLAQFFALICRNSISIIHDPIVNISKLFLTLVLALVIGMVLFGFEIKGTVIDESMLSNIAISIFVMMSSVTLLNMFSVVNIFHEELPLFIRENHNHLYRASAYCLAQQVMDIPSLLIVTSIFYIVSYCLVRLTWNFEDFILTGIGMHVIAQVSAGFGYLLAGFTSSIHMAFAVGPGFIIPVFLFAGFFIPRPAMDYGWGYVALGSWFHWGNEAMYSLQVKRIKHIEVLQCRGNISLCPSGPEYMSRVYGYDSSMGTFWIDMIILGIYSIILRGIGFCAILYRSRRK